jgi:hypothetical protein
MSLEKRLNEASPQRACVPLIKDKNLLQQNNPGGSEE